MNKYFKFKIHNSSSKKEIFYLFGSPEKNNVDFVFNDSQGHFNHNHINEIIKQNRVTFFLETIEFFSNNQKEIELINTLNSSISKNLLIKKKYIVNTPNIINAVINKRTEMYLEVSPETTIEITFKYLLSTQN